MLGLLAGRPSGTPIRLSDTPDWPPALLFDITYAYAVVHHFGTQSLTDIISSTWDNVFYPDGIMNKAAAEYKFMMDQRASEHAKSDMRNGQCDDRAYHRHPDTMDMLLFLPYILLPPNDIRSYFRHAEERAEEAERVRVQEKVQTWQKHIREQQS